MYIYGLKILGDILYFEVPGRPILVLNSLEDAEELLVKRASIYSARPESYMVGTLYAIPTFTLAVSHSISATGCHLHGVLSTFGRGKTTMNRGRSSIRC